MRRIICVICVLLCLSALPAGAGAEQPSAEPAGEQAETLLTPEQTAAVAFPMDTAPSWTPDATSVLVIDRDSGQVLYENGADKRTYPASTTKIMTALCAVEAIGDLDGTEITVRESVLGKLPDDTISLAGLEKGETLTARQMLYCLLLPSGNDAAVVLADYVSGSLDAFVERMNEKAAQLGCTSTCFTSVNGLSGPEHYTTARDMARIAEALLEQPDLAEIVRTPVYSLNTNIHKGLRLENTNHLIDAGSEYYLPSVTGIKTGSSTLSGRCLISSAEQNGMRLLCIIMGAPYMNEIGEVIEPSPAMVEVYNLYNWAFSSFTKVTLSDGVSPLEVDIGDLGPATVHTDGALTAVLPAGQAAGVTRTVELDSGLRRPLHKGQSVGEAVYTCAGTELARLPVVLNEDMASARWWLWLLPAAGAAALVVILCLALRGRRKRKKRRRKRAPAAAAPARPARQAAPARTRQERREESDFSPFVDYDDRPRSRQRR